MLAVFHGCCVCSRMKHEFMRMRGCRAHARQGDVLLILQTPGCHIMWHMYHACMHAHQACINACAIVGSCANPLRVRCCFACKRLRAFRPVSCAPRGYGMQSHATKIVPACKHAYHCLKLEEKRPLPFPCVITCMALCCTTRIGVCSAGLAWHAIILAFPCLPFLRMPIRERLNSSELDLN